MSDWILWPAQKAIYSHLSSDSALNALVTGTYDHVPPDAAFPYVYLGQGTAEDQSVMGRQRSVIELPIFVYSREGGKRETQKIFARLYWLLHDQTLSGDGISLYHIEHRTAVIRLLDDRQTYQGEMRFQIWCEVSVA
ncbi:MAG: DUF3168 domain-containing protein [Rickettsiales bacterium]|nr:DUF3168 domain-containing protein [Rickettsiales bacterium]